MGTNFAEAMAREFESGQIRYADDPFATDSRDGVAHRVRRRRTTTGLAMTGVTVVGVGLLAVAAVQAPFSSLAPASNPTIDGSPFECGFVLDDTHHEDDAVEIVGAGYMTVAEVAYMLNKPDLAAPSPAAMVGDAVVPYVTAVNKEDPSSGLYMGGEPPASAIHRVDGSWTGVSIVKVLDGRVVAVASTEDAPSGVTRSWGLVGNDGLSLFVLDASFFAPCPGVTTTQGADLYAVVASQTWDREQVNEPARYAWQELSSPTE